MLNGAADAKRHVQLRTHLATGLADLVAVRTPPVVGHGARCAHGRVTKGVRERLHEREVLRSLETAAA